MEQRERAKGGIDLVDISRLDPNGGVLVSATYWRPREGDPDPEHPGEKISMVSYLPKDAKDLCPCGSGKSFGACCRPLPYWRVVCPNPGMEGFCLMRPQTTLFTGIPPEAGSPFFYDYEPAYSVEGTPPRA